MAKISTVDYNEIPKRAREIRAYGQDINKLMVNAYKDVQNMKKDWYGQRYNTIVDQFNTLSVNVNKLLKLVVGDLPYALETVANNYAQADAGTNVTIAQNTAPQNVTSIPRSTEVGMKFITANVNETKNRVEKQFNDAVGKMNQIGVTFNKITWSSEAATEFKDDFNALKTNISESFNSIKAMFNKLVKEAMADIEKAEKANTVS